MITSFRYAKWFARIVSFLVTGLAIFYGFYSCKTGTKNTPLFATLTADKTGLNFINKLSPTPQFNMFRYMYFYNGAGVGAGDFNNDGLIDLFFAANQGENKLYLNRGKLRFDDATNTAHIPQDGGWSTGVSVVDINNDGLLDIYVCRVGNFETLHARNQLLVCTGIDSSGTPEYKDEAASFGLDFSGFCTQAVFFDYDMDGDLDCFLLNHSVHQQGNFAPRENFLNTYDSLSGDRLFRNDGGHFTDVTRESGINSSSISYGLGVAVSDFNLDGYPDLYCGNDFHENDYLYINQRNGTFRDELTDRIMHTSQFSMGVDVADINNDAYPDIFSADMLPEDPYILKRSLGEDAYDVFQMKINSGYHYQYSRNNLQLNRRNGLFSEIGLYAGLYASDWSWAPLWLDFDNDGNKDLFISNGIPKRLNDIDYVNYISNAAIQEKIQSNSIGEKEMALVEKFPQIKIPNKFYRNAGNYRFTDESAGITNNRNSYSNGAVYADLDNDGDLDIVVSNIDEPVWVYENRNNEKIPNRSLQLRLSGDSANIHAIGSRVMVFCGDSIHTYEKYPVRGFQSSMEIPIHIGLKGVQPDSVLLIWPDNHYQQIDIPRDSLFLSVQYRKNLAVYDFSRIHAFKPNTTLPAKDITRETGLLFKHLENPFVEFDREPLIPFMVSRDGPALAVGDMNGDGLEDVFIGSSKRKKPVLFLQKSGGRFVMSPQPALDADSVYEETDACWVDVNNDHFMDLVVTSGGNEYYGRDSALSPRVYLNNGRGQLVKLPHAFDSLFLTASCVLPFDFNGDGFVDLFIGGRAVPWGYGETPHSYLLENDGSGHFRDVTSRYSSELGTVGMVKQGLWFDLNMDGKKDLLLALEWGGIVAFINQSGHFEKKVLSDRKGWWNFILPFDADGDGDIDLLCGNLGLNSRLHATLQEPVRLYYGDFDGNGQKEQLLTYYLKNREILFARKEELEKQMPFLKKKFLYAEDFAKAGLHDIFPKKQLDSATLLSADCFENVLLINDGKPGFTQQELPPEAQFSSYRDALVGDFNNDALPDVLLVGNFYPNTITMGRNDADFGTILLNLGHGKFRASLINGLSLKGEIRHIRPLQVGKEPAFIAVRNNDSCLVFRFSR